MTGAARRWLPLLIGAALLALAALVAKGPLVAWFSGAGSSGAPDASGPTAATPEGVAHYTCPMHPSVHQATQGPCPLCGMDLVPVTREQQEQGVVWIDDTRQKLGGVRVSTVSEAPFERVLEAVGRVTYDESRLTDVTLRVDGWVTRVLVARTGERVTRGQPLFRLYSPALHAAEQDFLLTAEPAENGAARGAIRSPALAASGRQRLRLLGLSDAQIDALARQGVPSESVAVPAPASGDVIEKDVVEGGAVSAGQRVYRIAALDRVWVEADVYEAELGHVRAGQPARVVLDALPGRRFEARVALVSPIVDPVARRGRVRVELPNPERELRPGMYARVELATTSEPRLQVPASAVIYTGPRRLVFVDQGEGRFRPREVRVGAESRGMYEVLGGLQAGDRVASAGVFLIAAEARITTAAAYWEASRAESASAESAPAEPPEPDAKPLPPRSPGILPPDAPKPKPKSTQTQSQTPGSPLKPTPSPAARDTHPVYVCPMHPPVRRAEPGKCPVCGMALVPEPARGSP